MLEKNKLNLILSFLLKKFQNTGKASSNQSLSWL